MKGETEKEALVGEKAEGRECRGEERRGRQRVKLMKEREKTSGEWRQSGKE